MALRGYSLVRVGGFGGGWLIMFLVPRCSGDVIHWLIIGQS